MNTDKIFKHIDEIKELSFRLSKESHDLLEMSIQIESMVDELDNKLDEYEK